jgi:hypothetical protein
MTVEEDETHLRAAWIIRHSLAANLCDAMLSRSAGSLRTSRARAIARGLAERFQSMAAAERNRCALLAATIALAGHVAMTGLLPWPTRPMTPFSATSLVGAAVAIGLVTRRPRS